MRRISGQVVNSSALGRARLVTSSWEDLALHCSALLASAGCVRTCSAANSAQRATEMR